jgi:signal transduction histidine kinase
VEFADTGMRFVAAFCEVVTAKTKRLEAVSSDKAKSDFVSSVSHELCSPLHSILGSVEVLAEHGLNSAASTLVEQIIATGLETVFSERLSVRLG